MEVFQRIMMKRLDEHSYKRTAKRLVFDDSSSDASFSDKQVITNCGSFYDIVNSRTAWASNESTGNTTVNIPFSAAESLNNIPPNSMYQSEPISTITTTAIKDDLSRADKLLRNVAVSIRKRLLGTKPLVNSEKSVCKVNEYTTSSHYNETYDSQKIASKFEGKQEKQLGAKRTKKMIDFVDVCTIGRRHRNEHRKLLNEDFDDSW
ncbi:unnamed protein product [Thelazia callipaeda]|uniref:Uncharacterized protein n=1 Tax=Thelazia callipaeda TaxID=103827 RepID=A0A0N5CUQ2_THECL|nr:unnamed protein product [Thelazia callipaeda]